MTDDRTRTDQDYGHDVIGDEVVGGRDRRPPAPMTEEDIPAAVAGRQRAGKTRLRLRLLLGGLAVLLIGALFFYLHGGRYESTENAALSAHQLAVAANVSGQVVAIEVHENQEVAAGQVLFRIDPAPYKAAVAEAEARLADARAQIGSKRADYQQNRAGVDSAEARLSYAEHEAARQKSLLAQGISSQNQYDQAVLAVATAREAIETSAQQAESVRATLSGDVDAPADRQPGVRAAAAALDRAKLNLSYTIVRAPEAGIVTRVDQLPLGSYVTAAKPAFTLVGKRIWIVANFKESQLRYMRVGQTATVTIDAYPDRTLTAHVTSFSPGTGNSFALLPAENATGNWVKVIQRLPVQLEFDAPPGDLPLHAGLSASVSVDTRHVRHLFGGATEAPAGR